MNIELIGGPFDGKELTDTGQQTVTMAHVVGQQFWKAYYTILPHRKKAFLGGVHFIGMIQRK